MSHSNEPHTPESGGNTNWLRAAVLGANDGIVSVASIVVGVAGAAVAPEFVLTAGIAGLTAGALSMAAGEYVSVSTQRDTEKALLAKERWELEHQPAEELEELAAIYEAKGLSTETAHKVAQELTAHDAFAAHVEAELGIDPDDLTNPWHAALASAAAFVSGGIVPILTIYFLSDPYRIPATFAAVIVALGITGSLSAHAGGANKTRATLRVIMGGMFAMAITYAIGTILGVAGL